MARDGEGNVMVVSTKPAKAGRPSSLERTFEQVVQTTEELRERVDEGFYLVASYKADLQAGAEMKRWFDHLQAHAGHDTGDIDQVPSAGEISDDPPAGAGSFWHWKGSRSPAPRPGLAVLASLSVAPSKQDGGRREVERLLRSVSDEDLPLAGAYLSLLVERAKFPAARGSGGEPDTPRGGEVT